jgi:cob(I)alamin adenosyltransferase
MGSGGNRLTKIYTRSGDAGTTRLVGGQEVAKTDPRIEAYGTVDELSSVLGMARASNELRDDSAAGKEDLERWMRRLQNELFHLGAELATRTNDIPDGMRRLKGEDWQRLEEHMDEMNSTLGPLKDFILPGGGPLGAQLHLARTVCRRAERHAVALAAAEDLGQDVLRYLNRLSDYLFVLARLAARLTGHKEFLWEH